ncbi:MAG: glycosyltransferase [Candidatus Curtissbacteria bacterium]|nr:glycosyltransferase [Candidatus Curtissbacteria bacterium]
MKLVVNIPTYNEKENIEEVIKKVLAQSKNLKNVDLHVLVSDSHSPDGTGSIVKKISQTNPRVHYLDVVQMGLGVGVYKGHRFAVDRLKADVLAQMDGDLSHDPSTLPQMYEYIKKGNSLVNGSRLMKGGKNMLGWHRRLFTRGSAIYCKVSWGTFNLTEYTNSYRMFTKKLFESIDFSKVPWKSKTYIIQPAFLHAAIVAGAKIKEVPITFQDRKKGYSKAKIVSYTFEVLKFGLKIRILKSKVIIKFLIVGATSYYLSAALLGILNRGEVYAVPFLSKFVIFSLSKPLFSNNLFLSSVIAIEFAIIYNFIFHDNWTFKSRSHHDPKIVRLLKFNFSSISSPLIQLVSIHFAVQVLKLHEQAGLAAGVLFGLFVNYFVNILWIWKDKPAHQKTA